MVVITRNGILNVLKNSNVAGGGIIIPNGVRAVRPCAINCATGSGTTRTSGFASCSISNPKTPYFDAYFCTVEFILPILFITFSYISSTPYMIVGSDAAAFAAAFAALAAALFAALEV